MRRALITIAVAALVACPLAGVVLTGEERVARVRSRGLASEPLRKPTSIEALQRLDHRLPVRVGSLASPPAQTDPPPTLEAVWTLGRSGTSDAVLSLLTHPDPAVRLQALNAAGDRDDPALASEAARLLDADPDVGVRVAAAHLLGQARSWPEAVPALTRALARADAFVVSRAAADALGERTEPAAREALLATVRGSGPDPIRVAAARALLAHAVGPTGLAAELTRLARGEASSEVRDALLESAALALGPPARSAQLAFSSVLAPSPR